MDPEYDYEQVDSWTEPPPPARSRTLPSAPRGAGAKNEVPEPTSPAKPEHSPKHKGKNPFSRKHASNKDNSHGGVEKQASSPVAEKAQPKPHSERPLPPPPNLKPAKHKINNHEDIQKLKSAISSDKKVMSCETKDCTRSVDVICCKCKQLQCYRCGKGDCSAGKKHEIKDFEDYLAEHKNLYELWRGGKKNYSLNLDQEIRALSLAIKNVGQNLASCPLTNVPSCTKETIQSLMSMMQALDKMNEELKGVHTVLHYYDSEIENLSDLGFIEVVSSMSIDDTLRRCKKFNLGTFDTMQSRTIEHVTLTPDGSGVLASTSKAVELFNAKSVNSVGQVSLGGHVSGFHTYEGNVYVSIDLNNIGDKVSVYDEQFVEIRHWMTNVKVCDLTVNLDKVYLATIESKLVVYTTHGTFLFDIVEGAGTRLASHPLPNIIVVTNHEHDRVCAINGDTKEVLWSSEVEKPWGVAIDEYESIWVWSEFQQGVAIFDDKGNMKQEIEHPKLTGIGDVNSIAVKNGKLWVAFDGGMHRFQIGYY